MGWSGSVNERDAEPGVGHALRRRAAEVEEVGGAAIGVAAEAAEGAEEGGVGVGEGGGEDGVGEVDEQDLADDEVRGEGAVADREDLQDAAFEVNGRSGDAGGADPLGGYQREAGGVGLVDLGGNSAPVALRASARGSTAALRTNSGTARTFRRVSFSERSRRRTGEKTTTGGLIPKTLKKL